MRHNPQLAAEVAMASGRYSKPAALNPSFGIATGAGPVSFVRQLIQGACAGLLTLMAAGHIVAGVESGEIANLSNAGFDLSTLSLAFESYAEGGLPGALEVIGAAMLFLNAGRGAGRIVGLIGFVAVAVAHANGVGHDDFMATLTVWAQAIGIDLSAFGG